MLDPFGTPKPVIAMAHLGPLPGAPGYDRAGGVQKLVDGAAADIENLQAAGVDAIMFGNEGDRPYVLKAPPEGLAAMAAIISALKPMIRVPLGVNYLWDPVATVALAVATGAVFAREIFTGVYASDMGLWEPRCAEALRLRDNCGRADLKLLFNINAEFAAPLDTRPAGLKARSAVFSSLADIICVSGPITGQPVNQSELKEVKEALPNTPVFANTGVNMSNVEGILSIADGCVVGTALKVEGNTWNAVDRDRASQFMEKVRALR